MYLWSRCFSYMILFLISGVVYAVPTSNEPITVFIAKKIITMDPARPTAVAVRDGKILSVGTLQEMQPWLENQKYTLVDTFKNKILMKDIKVWGTIYEGRLFKLQV